MLRVRPPVLLRHGMLEPCKVATTLQLLAGSRLVVVTMVLSQPHWFGTILVVTPTCVGSQVVKAMFVMLLGSNDLVSVTMLSQPKLFVNG